MLGLGCGVGHQVREKRVERGGRAVSLSGMTAASPIPKNLRQTLVQTIESMTDEQVVSVHNAVLDAEIGRLRQLVSDGADEEWAAGKWDNLPEVVREYRDRRKAERLAR